MVLPNLFEKEGGKMIKIAVVGLGNLGRGVVEAVKRNPDMELVAVFTRRLAQLKKEIKVPVYHTEDKKSWSGATMIDIDVVILCGGSKEDTPIQGPEFAKHFSTVDSFDTHTEIPAYFQKMDAAARSYGNVSIISAGWDPGIFSLERILGDAFLPQSKHYTFWGKGVSQGHSDAARKVGGVLDARQYTIPIEEAIRQVRGGQTPDFSKREMHKRLVYVVVKEGVDQEKIRQEIANMPNYFDGYDTEVIFITQEEMEREHSAYPHGGFVLTSGATGNGNKQVLEYRLKLESNPEFTANVLIACARAAFRLSKVGEYGAYTMLDFPLSLLSPHSPETLLSEYM